MYPNPHFTQLVAEVQIQDLRREAEEARLLRAANASNKARDFQMLPTRILHKEKVAAVRILDLFRQPERFARVE